MDTPSIFTKKNNLFTSFFAFLGPIVQSKVSLTLLHSERPKLYALRKAKIAYNFGLSECDRVNKVISKQFVKSYSTYKIRSVSVFLLFFFF